MLSYSVLRKFSMITLIAFSVTQFFLKYTNVKYLQKLCLLLQALGFASRSEISSIVTHLSAKMRALIESTISVALAIVSLLVLSSS